MAGNDSFSVAGGATSFKKNGSCFTKSINIYHFCGRNLRYDVVK